MKTIPIIAMKTDMKGRPVKKPVKIRKEQARKIFMAGAGIGEWSDSLTKMAVSARFEAYWEHRR